MAMGKLLTIPLLLLAGVLLVAGKNFDGKRYEGNIYADDKEKKQHNEVWYDEINSGPLINNIEYINHATGSREYYQKYDGSYYHALAVPFGQCEAIMMDNHDWFVTAVVKPSKTHILKKSPEYMDNHIKIEFTHEPRFGNRLFATFYSYSGYGYEYWDYNDYDEEESPYVASCYSGDMREERNFIFEMVEYAQELMEQEQEEMIEEMLSSGILA